MTFNKLFVIPVGADLSRPTPIYRPSVQVSLSGLFCETSLSALAGFSTLQVNKHNWPIVPLVWNKRQITIAAGSPFARRGLSLEESGPLPTPRFLGIDEFARRKGHRYGPILCDLEGHPLVAEHASFGQNCFDASIGSVGVCICYSMPIDAYFFKPSFPFHRIVILLANSKSWERGRTSKRRQFFHLGGKGVNVP